jgi:hypothetical protein
MKNLFVGSSCLVEEGPAFVSHDKNIGNAGSKQELEVTNCVAKILDKFLSSLNIVNPNNWTVELAIFDGLE